jgi:Leucine-rich repeat (LRR) protein
MIRQYNFMGTIARRVVAFRSMGRTFFRLFLAFFAVLCAAGSSAQLKAQLYFFDGFPDAAVPSTWYNTPQGLGTGFGGANFAGQNLIVLGGRHAVVNGTMQLNGGTIHIQSGGQLTVVGAITGGGIINVMGGGTLRIEGTGNVAALGAVNYNAGAVLYYTGTVSRDIDAFSAPPDFPAGGVGANIIMHNLSGDGARLFNYAGATLTSSLTVSSGTVQLINSTIICNGDFSFQGNGVLRFGAGAPGITLNGSVSFSNGSFDATGGAGEITIGGAGGVTGALRVTTGSSAGSSLAGLSLNRAASLSVANSFGVKDLTLIASASLVVPASQTLTTYRNLNAAAGSSLVVVGSFVYSDGLGAVAWGGAITVENGGVLQIQANGFGGAGTILVQDGGKLRASNILTAGINVQYASGAATLEYFGTGLIANPGPELPLSMNGSLLVTMSGAGQAQLGNTRIIRGALTIAPAAAATQPVLALKQNASLTLKGPIITQTGVPTFGVEDPENGSVSLTIDSVHAAPIANFSITPANALTGNAFIKNFTLNRSTTIDLRGNLVIAPEGPFPNITPSTLNLQNGVIVPSVGNRVILLSSNATALVGGSTSAYVQGALQRRLRTSASVYSYPVGANGQYMPFDIINPVTAAPTADATPGVVVTPQIGFTGGVAGGQIATFAQNGRLWFAELTTITGVTSFRVQLADTNLVASNVIAVSPTRDGQYTQLAGTIFANIRLASTAPVGLPTMQSSLAFRVGNTTPMPTISGVSPVIVGSGATVLISGTNFVEVTRVGIGATTTAATYTTVSPTQIAAVLPASVANEISPAINAVTVNLSVTAQGGSTASVTTLTFVLPPQIISFFPTQGAPGTPIRITGLRFGGQLYNVPPIVRFGGFLAQSVVINSPGEITAIVPREATTGSITVSTPGGTAATLSTFTFVPPPRITDISPRIAPQGALVTISGTGFIQVSDLRIGGVRTQFTPNSSTRITAVISTGATGFVEITTPAGVITSATQFVFAPPPKIDSASPMVIGTGAALRVHGFGFVGLPEIALGQTTSAAVTVASLTELFATVPASLAPGDYPVSATTPGGATTGSFTVRIVPAPAATAFNPTSGTTGTIVQITGRNFLSSIVTSVRIAEVTAAKFSVVSDSLIIAETGRISTGGSVVVFARGGASAAPGAFANIAPPPVVRSFQPLAATVGTLVTVVGDNFNDANVLQIASDERSISLAEFTVVTNGQITFIMPANATSGNIVVGTSGGFARSAAPITFLGPPSIILIDPSFGLPGSSFTILGNNFNGLRRLLLGGVRVQNVVENSPTQITVTLDSSFALGFDLPITIEAERGTATFPASFSVVSDRQADSLALVEIYRRTVGSGWRQNANWLTLRPISEWAGVSVAQDGASRGRVERLILPQSNLQGGLPAALQFLTALKTLDLSGNALAGTFPSYVTRFSELEELRLGGLRLVGELPPSLGDALRRLRALDLRSNGLQGAIPRSLGSARGLEFLDLSGNAFADSLPFFIGELTALRVARFSGSGLRGALPSSLGALSLLEELDVSNNALAGTIPESIGSLRVLRLLSFANNRFSGALPVQTLRSLDSLRSLDLGGNRFVGVIPDEIAGLRRLRFLSLRANELEGRAPETLSLLDSLETLRLDSNRLTGALPATFENFRSLARLDVSHNQITSLPNLLRVRSLNNLNVANNRLDFSSLEPNALIDTLNVAPQDSVGEARRVGGIISIPVRLAVSSPGAANRYQWFKETPQGPQAVSPISRDSAFIFPFTSASSGTYTCRITNTLPELRALTLVSRPIRLDSAGVPTPPREIPEPVFPIDSIGNIVTTASLSWTRTTDASVYDVQLRVGLTGAPLLLSVADTALRLPNSTTFETLYFWRVRGRNITGETEWSAWNPFTTVAMNVEIAAFIPRFPRTPVNDASQRTLTLISNTSATISIQRILKEDAEESFELLQEIGMNFPIQPNSNITIPVRFQPKSSGRKAASLTIEYRTQTGGELRTQRFTNLLQGDGSPLKVVDVDFELVRVNKRTRAAVLLINRLPRVAASSSAANNVITVRRVEIEGAGRSAFQVVAFDAPLHIGAGDTSAIILRCEPTISGNLSARIKVVADVVAGSGNVAERDSSFGLARANAVVAQPTDYYAEVAMRPLNGRASAPPGSAVFAQVYYTRANLPPPPGAQNPVRPFIEGAFRFNRNVLALLPQTFAEFIPNSAPLNTVSRAQIFTPFGLARVYNAQARRDSTLIDSIACRIVAGATTSTPLVWEEFRWGIGGARSSKVFIEEANPADIVAADSMKSEISRAGGSRIIAPAAAQARIVAVQPNPALNDVEVQTLVNIESEMTLEILDARGSVVKTIHSGALSPGERVFRVRVAELPAGSYFIRLSSSSPSSSRGESVQTEKLQIVR